jgi:asparagine synthase (glutamine-hydrolysing)
MFHTPSIDRTEQQAEAMGIPLILRDTRGIKEDELRDLEDAIREAKERYQVEAVVSGAIASNYQKSRIESICEKLNLKSLTPLWGKDELEYLRDLLKHQFRVIITGVACEGLDKTWLGREIDNKFIEEAQDLNKKYKIHVAGEGGEFETFVLDCPLFKKSLKVLDSKISGSGNSWRMEVEVK